MHSEKHNFLGPEMLPFMVCLVAASAFILFGAQLKYINSNENKDKELIPGNISQMKEQLEKIITLVEENKNLDVSTRSLHKQVLKLSEDIQMKFNKVIEKEKMMNIAVKELAEKTLKFIEELNNLLIKKKNQLESKDKALYENLRNSLKEAKEKVLKYVEIEKQPEITQESLINNIVELKEVIIRIKTIIGLIEKINEKPEVIKIKADFGATKKTDKKLLYVECKEKVSTLWPVDVGKKLIIPPGKRELSIKEIENNDSEYLRLAKELGHVVFLIHPEGIEMFLTAREPIIKSEILFGYWPLPDNKPLCEANFTGEINQDEAQ